jgi:DNA-binding LacI/PurR family transcriptional regulator
MVTIRDLAALAGVSKSTVSRALRGERYVDPAVGARIQALARQCHYTVPPQGVVSAGRSRLVGCVLQNITFDYAACLLRGICDRAHATAHQILINECCYDLQGAPTALHAQIEQGVDAILIYTGYDHVVRTESILALWSRRIVPVLIADTRSQLPLDSVRVDEPHLAHLAIDYLVQLGHRRIAHAGTADGERWHAMQQVMQQRKLPTTYFHPGGVMISGHQPELADQMLAEWLALPVPPTAIIAHNDHAAGQLLLSALRRGVRVPAELSLLGCGPTHLTAYLLPALTTVDHDAEEVGRKAFDLAQQRIQEEEDPRHRPPRHLRIEPTLRLRDSCAPPPHRAYCPTPG